MLDIIKAQIGQEALDLVLDIIGVKDVLDCMKGQISGCLMAAVGLIPWTKLGKVALAMPAIRKLAGKTGSILEAFKKRSGALANKLDNARNTPACPVNFGASYSAQKGAVAKLGGEQRRLSFSFPDGRCVWALLGRLEDPVDDHRVWVRVPVGKHRALAFP